MFYHIFSLDANARQIPPTWDLDMFYVFEMKQTVEEVTQELEHATFLNEISENAELCDTKKYKGIQEALFMMQMRARFHVSNLYLVKTQNTEMDRDSMKCLLEHHRDVNGLLKESKIM